MAVFKPKSIILSFYHSIIWILKEKRIKGSNEKKAIVEKTQRQGSCDRKPKKFRHLTYIIIIL